MLAVLETVPSFVALKWASKEMLQFEQIVHGFSGRLAIIDNQLVRALTICNIGHTEMSFSPTRWQDFVKSHLLGATAYEVHICNHWPEWGVKLIDSLAASDFTTTMQLFTDQVV